MITVFNGKSFGLSGASSSGFVQIDRLLVHHISSFTPSGFVTFMALVMHVDNEGYCWPSIKRLCECTGLSETTVKSALHHLTTMKINDCRLLEINARTSPNGRTTSNGYKLFPDSMQHNDDVKVTSVKQEKKELAKEDDPAFILYKQFKVARYKLPTLELLLVTDKEWKDVRLTIWQMHKAGVTSDDVYIRTKELLGKWKPEMVTVRSLWKHWDTYASPTYGTVTTSVKIEDWFNDNNG
jgi:hypothetical protein